MPLLPVSVSLAVPTIVLGTVAALKIALFVGALMADVGSWLSKWNGTPPVEKFGSAGILPLPERSIARTKARKFSPLEPSKLAGVANVQEAVPVTTVHEADPRSKESV